MTTNEMKPISLTQGLLDIIVRALLKLPYQEVAPLLDEIDREVGEQLRAEAPQIVTPN